MRTCAVLPTIGLLQADFHIVAQIRAALAAAAASAPAAGHAEQVIEDVGESRGHVAEAAGAAGTGAALEGGMAETVIGRALVRILQDLVGFVDLLETDLAVLVARVAIGMPFHRELAEGGFQLAVGGGALDLENLVVAALSHARVHPRHARRSVIAGLCLVTHGAP